MSPCQYTTQSNLHCGIWAINGLAKCLNPVEADLRYNEMKGQSRALAHFEHSMTLVSSPEEAIVLLPQAKYMVGCVRHGETYISWFYVELASPNSPRWRTNTALFVTLYLDSFFLLSNQLPDRKELKQVFDDFADFFSE